MLHYKLSIYFHQPNYLNFDVWKMNSALFLINVRTLHSDWLTGSYSWRHSLDTQYQFVIYTDHIGIAVRAVTGWLESRGILMRHSHQHLLTLKWEMWHIGINHENLVYYMELYDQIWSVCIKFWLRVISKILMGWQIPSVMHTYLVQRKPWSWRRFLQGEAHHCTPMMLTLAITPNVGNSGALFVLAGDCVRAIPS